MGQPILIDDGAAPLREAWYYAVPSRKLRRGATSAKTMLGEPVLLGRDRDGAVFALRDLCPHRGMPLSAGRFDGCEVECGYHGWRFSREGRCTAIPSLVDGQRFDPAHIAVPTYPVREMQGNVWVYFGTDPQAAPAIPVVPGFGDDAVPKLTTSLRNAAQFDPTVVGLVDPGHVPFVHRSWWWRPNRSLHDKQKEFVPSPWGFTMRRHASSTNSRGYRLIGGAPETEISFCLPGVRIDHTRAGRNEVANLTAITPVEHAVTEINHCIYWTAPWLDPAKPLLGAVMRAFLRQDQRVLEQQQQGLRYDPPLAFADEADEQVRWYFRMKREYRRAREEGRPFENPVQPAALRWRS
jgi:phenylpropionate dioxygenase-like ring-hydroxylating dioxygenase large terminal subunit